MKTRQGRAAVLGLAVLLVLGSRILGQDQTGTGADPFYLKLLQEGEKSYLAQNYGQAVSNLRVACFGLSSDKLLLGKAYAYLSLSHFNLKQDSEAKDYLIKLLGLMDRSAMSALALGDTTKLHLSRLMTLFKLEEGMPSSARIPSRMESLTTAPAPETTAGVAKKANPPDPRLELEKAVKAKPKELQPYIDLYQFHLQNKDAKAARKTLEDLIDNIPGDPSGYFLLGQLRFAEQDYKKAVSALEKGLAIASTAASEDKAATEAKAYLLLSYNARKDKKNVESFGRAILGEAGLAAWESIALLEKDKRAFLDLLAGVESKKETARVDETAASAESGLAPPTEPAAVPSSPTRADEIIQEIRSNPGDAFLYYGLYDLYRQNNDPAGAKQVLLNLLASIPSEAKGHYLLGRVLYEERDYRSAQNHFEEVMAMPESALKDKTIQAESAAFLVLCAYYPEADRAGAVAVFRRYLGLLRDVGPDSLGLSYADRMRWDELRIEAGRVPLAGIVLKAITVQRSGDNLDVAIELSAHSPYRTFVNPKTRSLVIEIFRVGESRVPTLIPVNDVGVKAIAVVLEDDGTARVTFEGQTQIPSNKIMKTVTGLRVVVEKGSGPSRRADAPPL